MTLSVAMVVTRSTARTATITLLSTGEGCGQGECGTGLGESYLHGNRYVIKINRTGWYWAEIQILLSSKYDDIGSMILNLRMFNTPPTLLFFSRKLIILARKIDCVYMHLVINDMPVMQYVPEM